MYFAKTYNYAIPVGFSLLHIEVVAIMGDILVYLLEALWI